ncbi:hypothetical protein TWF718_003405 [Orbilia javanica]|uniref:Uncharacterized protein n=1 Tax=Orbilia javanica TaxID=47235 RepID=A0AAN8MES0_9PEZI
MSTASSNSPHEDVSSSSSSSSSEDEERKALENERLDDTMQGLPAPPPAIPLVFSLAYANRPPSHGSPLGQMPPEIIQNILGRVDQGGIGSFSLAASWCQVHADEMFYREVNLTLRAVFQLRANPHQALRVRELKIDCRIVAIMSPMVINFISTLTNLRTISFHSINSLRHAWTLSYMLTHITPLPSLRRIEISCGHGATAPNLRRTIGQQMPDWDDLEMHHQPKLEELSFNFGPLACVITRCDSLVFNVFTGHKKQIKVLEIKALEERYPSRVPTVDDASKHYILRCAEEEANPQNQNDEASLKTLQGFQKAYMFAFKSDALEVLRFYSETHKQAANSADREIEIQEVCELFPNLKDLDFVTRATWKSKIDDKRLRVPLNKLVSFSYPGQSKIRIGWGEPSNLVTTINPQPYGPCSKGPRIVMENLTRYWFPNIHNYGWYLSERTQGQELLSNYCMLYRLRRETRKFLWFVTHQDSGLMAAASAVFSPIKMCLSHWWGPATSSLTSADVPFI